MIKNLIDETDAKRAWVGVDIGGTKTAVVLSEKPPTIRARLEFPTLAQQGPERAIALIKQSIRQVIDMGGVDVSAVSAVGVSCGGPLDRRMGVIQAPPNLSTWTSVPIVSILENAFGVTCRLENDANAGAVAEHRFGAGKGTRSMVFLTMGTGLGAGIIIENRLFRGASEQAGEIGHVRLTEFGPVGYHKAGSVEGWASGSGMAQLATREALCAAECGESTILYDVLQRNTVLTAKDVGQAAQCGDKLALRVIECTGRRLGEALAILVDVLNPERIVVGGLALRLGQNLLSPAREVMDREALSASTEACEVVSAALGEHIGDVAALCVATGI